jgi:tripartite-type tricarboxylate transporter receptor subunit TctC
MLIGSQKQRSTSMIRRARSLTLGIILAASSIVTVPDGAAQANYPEKSVRMVVGFPAGSTADFVARHIARKLADAWGKPVVTDNIAGAAGSIAAERVAKAMADGYTLALAANAQIIINPSLYALTYDTVKDFAPISQVSVSPNLLVVHNSVPARTLAELVSLAKARPGDLTFASGGTGSSPHLAGEVLRSRASVDIRHIPYKGVVSAIPDLLAGRVMMMFSPITVVLPLAREGKLRALAVTSVTRSAAVPELPTIAESGYPGFEVAIWYGLLAPAGTPAALVRKIHLDTAKVLELTDLRAKFADSGLEVLGTSPDEFAAVIKSEIPKWAKVIKDSGINAN